MWGTGNARVRSHSRAEVAALLIPVVLLPTSIADALKNQVKRFLYDVWGDAVNVASRMVSNGEPGRVHVTEAVRRQLEGRFAFEERGGIEVKGKGRMTAYFLSALPQGQLRAEPALA